MTVNEIHRPARRRDSRESVLFLSESLDPDPVEGSQVLARELAHHVISCHGGAAASPRQLSGRLRPLSRLVPLLPYWRWLGKRRLAHLVYLPDAGLTIGSLIRAASAWLLLGRPQLDVIVTAHRAVFSPRVASLMPASWVFIRTQPEHFARWDRRRRTVRDLEPRVDPGRVADPALSRDAAKAQLGLTGQPVFVHVGHPRVGRNLHALTPLAESGKLVLVLSPYGSVDPEAVPTDPRITIIRQRVEGIGVYYRAADCYVFPTYDADSVIGLPMSIVEALANGTRVVARDSPLTSRWRSHERVTLVTSDADLVAAATAPGGELSATEDKAVGGPSVCLSDMTVCIGR